MIIVIDTIISFYYITIIDYSAVSFRQFTLE